MNPPIFYAVVDEKGRIGIINRDPLVYSDRKDAVKWIKEFSGKVIKVKLVEIK